MDELTIEQAREILVELDAEHLWSEADLEATVKQANEHPTRRAEQMFIEWVSAELNEGACATAEAEAMGDGDPLPERSILLVSGLDEWERLVG